MDDFGRGQDQERTKVRKGSRIEAAIMDPFVLPSPQSVSGDRVIGRAMRCSFPTLLTLHEMTDSVVVVIVLCKLNPAPRHARIGKAS